MKAKRILVVDDEPTVTRNLKLNLEFGGAYDVFADAGESHALKVVLTAVRVDHQLVATEAELVGA